MKIIDFITKIFGWVWDNVYKNDQYDILTRLICGGLLLVFGVIIAIILLAEAAEKTVKVLEWLKERGFWVFKSADCKSQIRRRKLFIQVVKSDLTAIGTKENWNDQAFSDLEAEVELEGAYYTSRVSRVYNDPVKGVRRVSSLIEAVRSAVKPHLLIVGEPGSGKSVALRHFALKLAEKGVRSGAEQCTVPLYINFRHFVEQNCQALDSSAIKSFVIDQIRHDSPTSSIFVEENWSRYCEQGVWFFLFDSFDEIPAVMHAVEADDKRVYYENALRVFVSEVGSCRVIVASREYKGPDGLGWDKLRILPLSFPRKEALVARSLVSTADKKKILHYLSEYDGALYNNPLFLTLLCRYVGDKGGLPETDYALLENHVVGTLERDADYLFRNYRLSRPDAIKAATRLAAVYASEPSISLAPTRSELEAVVVDPFLKNRLDDVLAGLVASKVMRKDISEASSRDIRYVFSHRRYQETLFVRFILSKDCPYDIGDLVSDTRWREYLVALLQSKSSAVIDPYVEAINVELKKAINVFPRQEFRQRGFPPLIVSLWKGSKVIYYMTMLLDGYRGRYDLLVESTKNIAGDFLSEMYASADIADQFMVVRFSVLAGEEKAKFWLREAIISNSTVMKGAAFAKVGDIKEPDADFAEFVRMRYSYQVLNSHQRHEILRMEAMLGRISKGFKCERVYRRCFILRSVFGWFIKTCSTSPSARDKRYGLWYKIARSFIGTDISVIPGVLIWLLIMNLCLALNIATVPQSDYFSWPVFLCSAFALIKFAFLVMYIARDEPGDITFSVLFARVNTWVNAAGLRNWTALALALAFVVFAPGVFVYYLARLVGYSGGFYSLVVVMSIVTFASLLIFARHSSRNEAKKLRSALDAKLEEKRGDALWVLLQSDDIVQFFNWVVEMDAINKLKNATFRRLFSILAAMETGRLSGLNEAPFLVGEATEKRHLLVAKQLLLDVYFSRLDLRGNQNDTPKGSARI